MKKYYVLLLVVMLGLSSYAQTVWDGQSEAWSSGEGSAENPYLIETGRHLAHLSDQVRKGETYKGKFFKLATDLNMGAKEGQKFTPIGFLDASQTESDGEVTDVSKYFLGTFDGNNKKIDNIYVYYIPAEEYSSIGGTGLFACLTEGSVVKNLGITGDNSSIKGGITTGAIAGCMRGGLVFNCYNEALIDAEGSYAGGIVGTGEKNGQVMNCYNTGLVKGVSEIGGICGQMAENFSIVNCYNVANVTATGQGSGGIVGSMYNSASLKHCYNVGAVAGQSGFLGRPQAIAGDTSFNSVVENCYYVKELTVVGDDNKAVSEKTAEELKSADFISLLNASQSPAVWVADTKNINGGFPLLSWQMEETVGIYTAKQELTARVHAEGNVVYVEFKDTAEQALVSVKDLTGKQIAAHSLSSGSSFTIADKGIYILVVRINGQQSVHKVAVR